MTLASLPQWRSDDGSIVLYCADCRDVLPLLEKGSVDAVVADPPFGVDMRAYQDDIEVSRSAIDACPGRLAACFMTPRRLVGFGAALVSWTVERVLWWHKSADIAFPWHRWHMNSEAILILSREGAVWPVQERTRSDLYQTGPYRHRPPHPATKPVEVIADITRGLTVAGAMVLDPFSGSGTTPVACIQTGRRCIGVEIDESYFRIGVQRCKRALQDTAQFFGKPVQRTLAECAP